MTSFGPQSDSGSLVAPPMSLSSSKSSFVDDMWSNQTSRRGSDASSIGSTPELLPKVPLETTAITAATAAAAAPAPPQRYRSSPSVPAPLGNGVSVTVSASDDNLAAQAPSQPSRPPVLHTDDALRRVYPRPAQELDINEALAREPQKWTLGHWKKNAHDLPLPPASVPFTPASKKRFEDIKGELRRSHFELASLKRPSPSK